MSLSEYMVNPDNFVAREHMLHHRLMFDLKLEAAKVGHNLLASTPEVDRDGYDVALWIDTDSVFLQCKAFTRDGQSSWRIHKKVICPRPEDISKILHRGFLYTHHGFGGGVLVISSQVREGSLDITYMYADLITIWAMSQNLVRKNRSVVGAASRLLNGLMKNDTTIYIPRSLLITPRTNAHLLALMGLESSIPHFHRSNIYNMLVDSSGCAININNIHQQAVDWLRSCSDDFT